MIKTMPEQYCMNPTISQSTESTDVGSFLKFYKSLERTGIYAKI